MIRPEFTRIPNLGQVWTPSDIALDMARVALTLCPSPRSILDPACGPGTFSIALHQAGLSNAKITSYDIDKRMIDATSKLNLQFGQEASTLLKDYLTETNLASQFDIVIMNPPYIRHEDILAEAKDRYHKFLAETLKGPIPRQANLFALFLLKGLVDLTPGGILCAIVYDAISQAGYGKKVMHLIGCYAELIFHKHIRTPFDDVLVDAQIVVYRKRARVVERAEVEALITDELVLLGDLLNTRRGTGLPVRKAFLANRDDPYYELAAPFFIKQARLNGLVVQPDKRAYLADTIRNPHVREWVQERAMALGYDGDKMEIKGVSGPILFNYYVRDAARHLWNPRSIAVSDNFYVSIPSLGFPAEAAWLLLNCELYLSRILSGARSQGNGLLKLQLYEYKNIRVPDWRTIPNDRLSLLTTIAKTLIARDAVIADVKQSANQAVKGLFDA